MKKHRTPLKRQKRLTSDELLFQPWFLSAEIAQAIRVLIPPGYQRKMRDYFDVYGCLRCKKKDAEYQANAMCRLCANIVTIRLRKCVQRRLDGNREMVSAGAFVGTPRRASKLLRGIWRGGEGAGKQRRNHSGPPNPALDAYHALVDQQGERRRNLTDKKDATDSADSRELTPAHAATGATSRSR